ncbi:polysaccharide biosynthesis/export family protein [Ferribacterium limneticum]|uniref:polysaccharide biosynthesis/export family protein n=1 Tax=Ferribacterium limneticum TaxID=76259 RepID=UPI001CFB89A3|nr:polysaccharide biosynthesis/export family protein [Ferribacterium limneticum]UCV20761.1 polysaccharide export protein [Ferribacterium limneticum]
MAIFLRFGDHRVIQMYLNMCFCKGLFPFMNCSSFSRVPALSTVVFALAISMLAACSSLPSSGANKNQVLQPEISSSLPIRVVDIDDATARRVFAADKRIRFADVFTNDKRMGYRVGAGDVVEVSIWEAPPATLFGSTVLDPRAGAATTRVTTFPEQMVSYEGAINIPFAGMVPAAGKSPQEIESEIARRLHGKANQAQVLVRITRNATSNVTVVGEVTQSLRMPLTAKGERLLDAIAASGGVRQPVGKMTVQVTRGDVVQAMALDTVIQDPKQNIVLQPGDVVTALFQPLSFTALGATGKNEEVFFEAQGITLAQALARSGGLQDNRADSRGVFIFRYEEPLVLGVAGENPPLTPDGKVPVIYRVDLKDPRSFFVAQGFPIRNKDVMYISNAPAAELQKFLNILTSVVFTAQGLGAIR